MKYTMDDVALIASNEMRDFLATAKGMAESGARVYMSNNNQLSRVAYCRTKLDRIEELLQELERNLPEKV
jgi:predicted HAD superfamily phosphohydrolase YqeG